MWVGVWDPIGLTSFEVAQQRAGLCHERHEAPSSCANQPLGTRAVGQQTEGDEVLRFKTMVNKRMETYNGQRFGVDLAEGLARAADGCTEMVR